MKRNLTMGWTAVSAMYTALAIETQSWGLLAAATAFALLAYAWHRWAV